MAVDPLRQHLEQGQRQAVECPTPDRSAVFIATVEFLDNPGAESKATLDEACMTYELQHLLYPMALTRWADSQNKESPNE